MHTDGYAGFGKLARAGPVREVACRAHVRRKFFDVHAARGSAIAAEALECIAALYAIEKDARGQPPDRRVAIRGAKAGPRLDDLERWLQTAKTPLAAAIRYALTRLKRLRPYLEHGFLEIDNNPAERAMSGRFASEWLWCMDLRISISGSASVFESLSCLSSSTHRVATISPEPSTGS